MVEGETPAQSAAAGRFIGARQITVGRMRINPQFDFYNLLNASPILSQIETYGS